MSPEILRIIDFPLAFQCFCLIFDVSNISIEFKWILVRPGDLLGTSWGVVGRLGCILARLGGRLGASWGRLAASWGSWRHLGPSWRRLGLQKTPKTNLISHGTGSAVHFSEILLLASFS